MRGVTISSVSSLESTIWFIWVVFLLLKLSVSKVESASGLLVCDKLELIIWSSPDVSRVYINSFLFKNISVMWFEINIELDSESD